MLQQFEILFLLVTSILFSVILILMNSKSSVLFFLARMVMCNTEHVFLVGSGAETFATDMKVLFSDLLLAHVSFFFTWCTLNTNLAFYLFSRLSEYQMSGLTLQSASYSKFSSFRSTRISYSHSSDGSEPPEWFQARTRPPPTSRRQRKIIRSMAP